MSGDDWANWETASAYRWLSSEPEADALARRARSADWLRGAFHDLYAPLDDGPAAEAFAAYKEAVDWEAICALYQSSRARLWLVANRR